MPWGRGHGSEAEHPFGPILTHTHPACLVEKIRWRVIWRTSTWDPGDLLLIWVNSNDLDKPIAWFQYIAASCIQRKFWCSSLIMPQALVPFCRFIACDHIQHSCHNCSGCASWGGHIVPTKYKLCSEFVENAMLQKRLALPWLLLLQ